MANLAGVLADIPGLAGYTAQTQVNDAQSMGNLQQAGGAMGLMETVRKHQQAQQFRGAMDALGPNPDPAAAMAVATKFAGPDKIIDVLHKSEDRKAASAERAAAFAQTLEMKQAQLDQKREQFEAQQRTAQERMQFEQWYKTQSLGIQQQNAALNAHLKGLGLEIQKQGNEIRLTQINATRDQQNERTIEQQVGKTADRMKDVAPVLNAAKQLNVLMSKYTPDNIPGVGYLKNTDVGKIALTGEGKDVSASIKLFGNSVLKAMSGAAVTAPEEIRQMAAQMADGRFSAKDFYIAWPKMAGWVNSQAQLSAAGLTPPARERFVDRTGMDLAPITPRYTFDSKTGKMVDTQAAAAAGAPAAAVPAPAAPAGLPPLPPGFKLD